MSETIQPDNDAILDAIKELTKQVTSLTKEIKELKESWEIHRKAGKF